MDQFEVLISALHTSIREDNFARLTLSKPTDKNAEVKKLIIRMAIIKDKRHFTFVHRYPTKDITKNHDIEKGGDLIIQLMQSDFEIANLFTTEKHFASERLESGDFKVKTLAKKTEISASRSHDKKKKSLLSTNTYLKALGILNSKGNVQKDMGDKHKQINKYVEIIDGLLRKNKSLDQLDPLHIVDMGSGKGYLTFALYDFLKNTQQRNVILRGIEMRSALVDLCNGIAQDNNFDQLHFEGGVIQEVQTKDIDVLIALHACDTATDDAIEKGIKANASLIICAPCCHRQVRKDIHEASQAADSIYQYGILKERQAELVTDTMRALYLQLYGYKTNVFEFISTEHTGKNLMITAIKHNGKVEKEKIEKELSSLKSTFGIGKHYLEEVL